MITFFRRIFSSKIGLAVALAFLGLIALAFASMDVANTGTFGGVAGGNRVAVVGDQKIGSAELSRAATSALDRARQENPTLSMAAFLEQGGLDEVLAGMIDRFAIGGYAERYGLRAGDNLINSEIVRIPAFQGPDGNFSQQAYQAALQQAGLTDALFREDATQGLLAQQILVPASFGAKLPNKLARRYAALDKERREGAIGLIPSLAYAPSRGPTEAQLQAYYRANRGDYIRPERRVIRYATFGDEALQGSLEPTEAEIAARYKRDANQYRASETRRFSQLIVPTEAAARAIRTSVQGGETLEAAARRAGFSVAQIGPVDRAQLSGQASPAVTQAVFAANQGTVAEPARSGLGWHVVRVDDVTRTGGQTLAQARGEIVETLRVEKRRLALNELASELEDQLASGTSLTDVARSLGVELQSTKPLVATGQVYGSENEFAPEVIGPALQSAFEMQEGEPQLAEVERGETFIIYEASNITPSAAAPLNEIRDVVSTAWRLSEGSKLARAAADRIIARLKQGQTLAAAMRAEGKPLTPESVNLTREQLRQQPNGRVPAPLVLMFSMAQGTAKKLEAPQDSGWFVVDLDRIEAGDIAADDPVLAQARQGLGLAMGREYADQLRQAIRTELGYERNPAAIEAVRKQLAGEN